jgi:hypothetical protein
MVASRTQHSCFHGKHKSFLMMCVAMTEPSRNCRRLHFLRGWGSWQDEADIPQSPDGVFGRHRPIRLSRLPDKSHRNRPMRFSGGTSDIRAARRQAIRGTMSVHMARDRSAGVGCLAEGSPASSRDAIRTSRRHRGPRRVYPQTMSGIMSRVAKGDSDENQSGSVD